MEFWYLRLIYYAASVGNDGNLGDELRKDMNIIFPRPKF